MNVNVINGIGIDSSQKKRALHVANSGLMLPGRTAFKQLLKWNVWGLATALNLAWARSAVDSRGVAVMGSVKQKWDYGWYNLGGKFNNLQAAVNMGRGKKAIMLKVAPQNIKRLYYEATGKKINGSCSLGSYNRINGVDPATLTAAAAAITALASLIKVAFRAAGKDLGNVGVDDVSVFENDPENGGNGGNGGGGFSLEANLTPILITVAAGALLFGGDMIKTKPKRR